VPFDITQPYQVVANAGGWSGNDSKLLLQGGVHYLPIPPYATSVPSGAYFPPGLQRRYDQCAVATVGDSRLAQAWATQGTAFESRYNAGNFIPWAMAMSGQRIYFPNAYGFAVSGLRSDQYALQIDKALATNAYWLVTGGVLNDIASFTNTVDYWNAYIKPICMKWIASGRMVIIQTESGSGAIAGAGAASIGAVHKYNRQVIDFCRQNENALCLDVAGTVISPGSSMTFRAGYSSDTTHINMVPGAQALATKFLALIQPFIQPSPRLVVFNSENPSNGAIQLFSNPLFMTTTGGTGGTGITGTIPAGITSVSGGAIVATAVSTAAGVYGTDLILTMTAGGAGTLRVVMDLGALESPGDVLYMNCEVSIDSGSSNLSGCSAHIESNRASSTAYSEGPIASTTQGNLPTTAQTYTLESGDLTIQTGTRGWLTPDVRFSFSAAGSAVAYIRRLGVWRKQAF
jgi:hypothetical protein